ncbi:MAG: ABC transporter permease, partial [Gemmatimonadaceae bacterium]
MRDPRARDPAPQAWRRYLTFWRADLRADVDDELAFHLEMRAADLQARGLSAPAARAAATRDFGDVAEIRGACVTIDQRRERREHRTEVVGDMWNDLRFALRTFRRQPGFTAAVVCTLALGIGASTAMFSLVDAALLRALPFAAPERLVVVWGTKGPERAVRGASFPEVSDWRTMNHSFGEMSLYDQTTLNLRTKSEPIRVTAEMVSANFFTLLGVNAARGRTFLAEEDASPDKAPVVVISDELWRTRLGGDPGVIGSSIVLNDRALTIVGVMPPGFRGLAFTTDVWYPGMMVSLTASPGILGRRGSRWLMALARLKPAVDAPTAQRDLDAVAATLAKSYPESNANRGALVMSLRKNYLGNTESLLVTLFGAVLLFLLIACVNVTSLQLVRAIARRQEIAIRLALGADRMRLVRQLLAEGMALAVLGGAAGALVAFWGVRALAPLVPAGLLPPYARLAVDGRALAFGLGVSLTAGIVFGVVPALRSSRNDLTSALKAGSRASSAGLTRIGRPGVQQLLVVGQVALALMLLTGAGLMLRSLQHQLAVSPGVRADGVFGARITLPAQRYAADARITFNDQLLARLRAMPALQSASLSSDVPFDGVTNAEMMTLEGGDLEGLRYYVHTVSPEFFSTLGIPLVRGRSFGSQDAKAAPPVAIISDAMAKRYWPTDDPIGKRFSQGVGGGGPAITVIGVVGAARFRDLTSDLGSPGAEPDVYFALSQRPKAELEIAVRTRSGNAPSLASLQKEVASLDPSLPLFAVQPLSDGLRGQSATGRFGSLTLGVFSIVALVLSGVGIYGVVAFVVGRSRREIAIRMALGARGGSVLALIVRGGLALAAAGVAVGLGGSAIMSRALASQLFGVKPTDPLTIAAVSLLVMLVALAATAIPARR